MVSSWWVAELFQSNPGVLVATVFWVIFSITLHELGHGWAALRMGDDTPIETGHMTWNPLVHMGGTSLILFALAGIAWGLMPVNPSRMRGRHAPALVAAAGPAVNVALALVCALLAGLWIAYATMSTMPDPAWRFGKDFLETGAMLNIALVLLNLLPVPPLDGSRILAHFSRPYAALASHPALSLAAFLVVFLFAGRHLFPVAHDAADRAIGAVAQAAPGGASPTARLTRWINALTPDERAEVQRIERETIEGLIRRLVAEAPPEQRAELERKLRADFDLLDEAEAPAPEPAPAPETQPEGAPVTP